MLPLSLTRHRLAGTAVLVAGLAAAGTVATAAGGPTLSFVPGSYDEPRGVAFAADGSYLVADTKHHRVYRVSGSTVTSVAGTGDGNYSGDGGQATNARLKEPAAVAPIPGGGFLIADTKNHRIRMVTASGVVTTVAGTGDGDFDGDNGPAMGADIKEPAGLVATSTSTSTPDFVFADAGNDRVRRVTGGTITTVGSGLDKPSAVALRSDGAIIVADTDNDRVAVLKNGSTTTLPGGAGLRKPRGVAVRADGSVLVSDTDNHQLVEVRDGQRTILAGTGSGGDGPAGSAAAARLDKPEGLSVSSDGRILLANTHADRVHLLEFPADPAPPAGGGGGGGGATSTPGSAPMGPGGPQGGIDDGAGADGIPATLERATAPKLGRSVTTGVARGTVRVRPPGADDYVVLDEPASVPLGSVIDTSRGAVRLTAARDATGGVQTATFSYGAFKVGQTLGKRPITDLVLTGPAPACPSRKSLARSSATRSATRRLWGDGKGRFRTKGRHSSATVRGTRWLTEDRCSGTLVKVVHGIVDVRDLARGKTVVVRGGKQYLTKAPPARPRASR